MEKGLVMFAQIHLSQELHISRKMLNKTLFFELLTLFYAVNNEGNTYAIDGFEVFTVYAY